jgi:hypothetical protein
MTINITYRQTLTPSIPGTTTVKGSPLTWEEHDANFKSIQNELSGRQSWYTNTEVTTASVTAVAGNHYILKGPACAVTMPASPVNYDLVKITIANGLTGNTLLRNGNTIEDIADDFRFDNKYLSIEWQYLNNSWRMV